MGDQGSFLPQSHPIGVYSTCIARRFWGIKLSKEDGYSVEQNHKIFPLGHFCEILAVFASEIENDQAVSEATMPTNIYGQLLLMRDCPTRRRRVIPSLTFERYF